ncbi:uncharacterized protein LOC143280430 [Babylonia areolata]|uniref:uncharacterized protein LOC143280430 n=1 Tax=Babylonia areolata TaxID=304850 RepID=UPI003FD2F5E5
MKRSTYSNFVLLVVVCMFSEAALPSVGPRENVRKCQEGYYGYNCRHHCHCAVRSECDVMPRCHSGCADGWSGPTCQSQNIAFGMPTKIRSRDLNVSSLSAVDGKGSTCVTSDPDNPGWLRVDLQRTVSVYHLTLVTDSLSSPRGWQLFVTQYSDFYWATPCTTVRSARPHVTLTCDSPTRGQFLTVLNTQGPVTVCEVQAHVCADYTFGASCGGTCRCADASEVCHPLTGHCHTGCRPGFSGRHCQHRCNMTYGNNCVIPCGHCSRGTACHPVSGACPGSCQQGWTGPNCDTACPAGRYGQGCARKCGGCQDPDTCAPVTGLCPGLCRSGLQGPSCDQACEAGKHGPSCQFDCGHCLTGTTCNTTTGICSRGCDSGWEGLFCTQECLPHNYGMNCHQECRHCLTSCDSHTGLCDVNGCSAGKMGRLCDQDCEGGYFGLNCSTTCGHCLEEEQWCDVTSGQCPRALCQAGWTGHTCHRPCRPRTYGMSCSMECGMCEGSDVCDPVTGLCPRGCADGYHGDMCQTLTIFMDTTSEASISLIACVLTASLLVLVVVCVCLALKWRRDHHAGKPADL